jgi:hypothetical protein
MSVYRVFGVSGVKTVFQREACFSRVSGVKTVFQREASFSQSRLASLTVKYGLSGIPKFIFRPVRIILS